MNKNLVSLEFYETYYNANILTNIISDPFTYIHKIHDWYVDDEEEVFLTAFPKLSRLHGFASHVISELIWEKISEVKKENNSYNLWIDRALKYHDLPCEGFGRFLRDQVVPSSGWDEDNVFDYHQELMLTGEMGDLIDRLSMEVFHVLFANRKVLRDFNVFLSSMFQGQFSEIPSSDLGQKLKKPGVLKRVGIPMWVKRAVFYRDRGMCSLCQKDLSGILSTQPDSQYDHMIPLAEGGMNDVTNIQLLCQSCNGEKSGKVVPVSSLYESWY